MPTGNFSPRDIKRFRMQLDQDEKDLQELTQKLEILKREERESSRVMSEAGTNLRKKQVEIRRTEIDIRTKESSKKRRERELQDLERQLRYGDYF